MEIIGVILAYGFIILCIFVTVWALYKVYCWFKYNKPIVKVNPTKNMTKKERKAYEKEQKEKLAEKRKFLTSGLEKFKKKKKQKNDEEGVKEENDGE